MDPSVFDQLGSYMLVGGLVGLAFYIYLAICLSTMARKNSVPDGWMAWVPVLNAVLMCRLAGKSGWWVLLFLLPVINIIFILIVWANIAKARGKSPILGIAIIVPFFGFLVPALLAAGDASTSPAPPQTPVAGSAPPPQAAAKCPVCGSPDCVGSAFCAYTGQPIAQAPSAASAPTVSTPAAAPAAKSGKAGPVLGSIAAIVVVLAGIYLWLNRSSSTVRAQPQLPPRMAGTMKEFPIDSSQTNPARPVSVVTRTLSPNTPVTLPAGSMPNGIDGRQLPQVASSMASAVYRSSSTDPGVNVHVLGLRPPEETGGAEVAAGRISSAVVSAAGPGAMQSRVQTTSPSGEQFQGVRVRNQGTTTYVFSQPTANTVVVVYSQDPAAQEETDRLASNLGNGAGVMEDPTVANTFSMLPVTPPPGYDLTDLNAFTQTEMQKAIDQVFGQINGQVSGQGSTDLGTIQSQIQRFLPEQLTVARYTGGPNHLTVVVGDYGSPFAALSRWMVVRGLWQAPGATTQEINGTTALISEDSDSRWMLMHNGQFVTVLNVPRQLPEETLRQLTASLQVH